MAFSITELVNQIKQLEKILAEDFQELSSELRKKPEDLSDKQVKLQLVKELQYHDILRQKLEHIRQFQEGIIAEQGDCKKEEKNEEMNSGLIELSLALLRFSEQEYLEVNSRVHHLLRFPNQQAFGRVKDHPSFEQTIRNLILDLQELGKVSKVQKEQDLEKYRQILSSFTMQSERDVFSVLFDQELPEDEEETHDDPEGQVELF